MLGPCWEYDPVWLGPPGTLNTSECPKDVVASSLSQILQASAPFKYYLTRLACLGILRRAEERNKPLPPMLEWALRVQAGLTVSDMLFSSAFGAYAINQRKEGRDLGEKSAALTACTGTEMQTFITEPTIAGFLAESSATAGTVGYEEELAPTMKAGGKSGAVLCLNNQGGGRMDCGEEQSGTLRAQTHGHEPLVFANHGQGVKYSGPIDTSTTVTAGYGEGGNNTPFVFENHGIDARYTGPHEASPTMSARYGTGGNNVPLVGEAEVYCITGNAIGREPQNGGNGLGIDEDVSHTLTATDRHAVFSRQRTDVFRPDEIASTESARQHKDATDLVYDEAEVEVLDLPLLIRRLMPIECERLQGFPDGWTDIPGASDAARYKALGNSVAIPCVQLLLLGISLVLRAEERKYTDAIQLCNMLAVSNFYKMRRKNAIKKQT